MLSKLEAVVLKPRLRRDSVRYVWGGVTATRAMLPADKNGSEEPDDREEGVQFVQTAVNWKHELAMNTCESKDR